MNSGAVQQLAHPVIRRHRPLGEWWGLAVAVVVTAVIGLALPPEPDRVRVTIENPTDHRLYINSSSPDDGSINYVAVIDPRSTATSDPVVDRGISWVLHLRTLGAPAGTVTVSRDDLIDGSFAVPMWVNDDLAAAGVPPDLATAPPGD